MGLLAPLFALAALAVIGPILFHLIQRRPRGEVEFSSLMFLRASTPRLTRRSRLNNLWLLFLRAAIVCLIAVAFARPFVRSTTVADVEAPLRELLLVIDISGSMQREQIWDRAMATAHASLAKLGANDRVGLATLDTYLRIVVPLEEVDSAIRSAPALSHQAVQSHLAALRPGYRSTELGTQLIAAAELLTDRNRQRGASAAAECEIILISDLHEGGQFDEIPNYAWPESVRLVPLRISSDQVGNARASLLEGQSHSLVDADRNESASETKASQENGGNLSESIRVRVENNANSTESSFNLTWVPENLAFDQPPPSSATMGLSVQVPPGQTRIVQVSKPNLVGQRIQLSGDATNFDNAVHLPHTPLRHQRLGYLGMTRARKEDDLFFYLSQIPLDTPLRSVTINRINFSAFEQESIDRDLMGVVVQWPTDPIVIPALQRFCESGRPVIVVLDRIDQTASQVAPQPKAESASTVETSANSLASATGSSFSAAAQQLEDFLRIAEDISMREIRTNDFALLTDIAFENALFRPLSSAKFNDFGKIRFWAHRQLKFSGHPSPSDNLTTLARFDDGDSALLHRTLGRGDAWILTAGWQSTESQLALSSKFVPLLFGMLDPNSRSLDATSIYEVGEVIPMLDHPAVEATRSDRTLVHPHDMPDGYMPVGNGIVFDEPGLYWIGEAGQRRQISVILPMSESQLDPLDLDRFAQLGINTSTSTASAADRKSSAQRAQGIQLENQQKLWRWLLSAAVVLLIIETLIATRFQLAPIH